MRRLIVDIEGNGLLEATEATPALDTVWCLVIRDQDTRQIVLSCANTGLPDNAGYPTIEQGLKYLMDCDPEQTLIVIHNGIGYDYPGLRRVFPWFKLKNIRRRLMDTLVIGGMLWAHLKEQDAKIVASGKLPAELRGSHKLKALGIRLGCHKGEYAGGWDKWSPDMQKYCEQDTMTLLVYAEHIAHRIKIQAEQDRVSSEESIETELELAWYLFRQEKNGWPFNVDKAQKLYAELAQKRSALVWDLKKAIKPWLKPKRHKGMVEVKTPAKNRVDKARSTTYRDPKNPSLGTVPIQYTAGAAYSCLEWVEFNPSSRPQIADRLTKLWGWQPQSFTKSGQPEVDEDSLDALVHIPEVKLIQEYLLLAKRIGQLAEGKQAWLIKCRLHPITGRMHIFGRIKQNGTVTHRGAHVDPNIGQVPAVGNPYGAECRELFEVPPCPICGYKDDPECPAYEDHWVQVGADQSGLELRMLSHYMAYWDNGDYGRAVIGGNSDAGTDVHSKNRDALGLSGKKGRAEAKTFIYAFLYGAGDLKLGLGIVPSGELIVWYQGYEKVGDYIKPHKDFAMCSKRWARMKESLKKRKLPTDDRTVACAIHGGELRAKFIKGVPALGELTKAVKANAEKYKFLLLLDKRRVYIRHAHAALNSLLQGSGAVVCKRWIVIANRKLEAEFGKQGWDYLWAAMGWIHDEVQIACKRRIHKRLMEILVEAAVEVGVHYNLRCPTAGEAKVGKNWKDCH
jgi:DNA polymerase-1